MKTAKIAEIFETFQGEGIYLGERQVFVRFFGCATGCVFCDTPLSDYREYDALELKDKIAKYQDYHSLCLTGGEPLAQADFIKEFLDGFADLGVKVYLETNGILTDALAKLIERVDYIAMDFKLPSSTKRGAFWKEHEEFLKIALSKEVFVKIVVARQTTDEDISKSIEIIQRNDAGIPVVLQPNWFEADAGLIEKMEFLRERFKTSGILNVKILPQAHKLAGIK
jgi:organic radical activating enzyme